MSSCATSCFGSAVDVCVDVRLLDPYMAGTKFHGSNSSMRLIGGAREHVAQVGLRVEPVELGRLHQIVDGRGALAAGVRAPEEVVLSLMRSSA